MAPRPSGPKTFAELGCLSPKTVEVLHSLGFVNTTPVQEATIPLFCGHKDVAVDACTGSGKTLAFVLPVVERLRRLEEPLKPHQVGAIIISPTRELAKQIHGVAEPFFASVQSLKSMLLVGGTDPAQDVAGFKARGGHVLVGTPGRIEDFLKRCPVVDLRRLEVLVLDEADRLLDMGFQTQLDSIMARLPKQRRTGLFSATQTEAVQELARAGLRNPLRVNVAVSVVPQGVAAARAGQAGLSGGAQGKEAEGAEGKQAKKRQRKEGEEAQAQVPGAAEGEPAEATGCGGGAAGGSLQQKTPNSLSIQYVVCEADEKVPQLVRFLRLHGPSRKVIVYAMTCAAVDHLAAALPRLPQMRGVRLKALHGKMKQAAREATLEAFRGLPAGVLLCTDLAARGLDIPDVHWIVQLDPPQDPAAFVHRVGRTARMGRAGNALVYLMPHEESYVEFLRLRKVPLTEGTQLPAVDDGQPSAAAGDEEDGDRGTGVPSTSGRTADDAAPAAANGKAKGTKVAGAGKKVAGGGAAGGGAGTTAAACPSTSTSTSTATSAVLAALRSAAERDRDVMEKAAKAFVTYVRGYKEHHCKFIFRLQDLNIGRLATGLGLLRLPKMPDLKRPLGMEHFKSSPVDPASVPFKDKAREKQRRKMLQQRQAEVGARQGGAAGAAPVAASKRKLAAGAHAAAEAESRLPAAKRRQLQQIDELASLNKEYSLLKKLKKGKISQHQYDVALGLSSDSEMEGEKAEGGRSGGAAKPNRQDGERPGSNSGSDSDDDGDDGPGTGPEAGAASGGGQGGGLEDGSGGAGSEGGAVVDGAAAGRGSGRVAGRAVAGGPKPGGRTHGSGGASGRTHGSLGVKQPRGALQSYIDKRAKKKQKQKRRQQRQP